MHHFTYQDEKLLCEEVPVAEIAAAVGTPFYLYSAATLRRHFQTFDQAFSDVPHHTCFAAKACSNIAILHLFASLGGGADIVSGGELYRALQAGVDPDRIVYSGVGKSEEEMRFALANSILMFNVESMEELHKLRQVAAAMKKRAPVSLRVNPDVDPRTHAYISTGLAKNKFGVPVAQAEEVYLAAREMPEIEIKGVSCHIGSQLTELSPFVESLGKLKSFITRLRSAGIPISHLDLGGGLGIRYNSEEPPPPAAYAAAIKAGLTGLDCTLILEPGRVIVGNAGILVTRVLYTKEGPAKKFIIVDAGMNDLARPSLYGAYHAIQPVGQRHGTVTADVVGPICETGDFLARDQEVPAARAGELLAVMSAGAYGFSMASNYNSRPRVAEVLVSGQEYRVIRERESYEDLIRGERLADFP
jgi:diaminopimelate decarboxylase